MNNLTFTKIMFILGTDSPVEPILTTAAFVTTLERLRHGFSSI